MIHGFDDRYGMAGWAMIRAGRRLGARALVTGAEGNLSSRLPTGNLLITAAGKRKDELQPEDLLIIDPHGAVVRGEQSPSTETAMHLSVYASSSEAGAVVHAHPVAATAFAVVEKAPLWTATAEAADFVGPVALVPYARPGTAALGLNVRPHLRESRALLLAHHGALTIGATLEEALRRMELLERLCEVECQAAAIGGARPLAELPTAD